jgi:hypothetical protein
MNFGFPGTVFASADKFRAATIILLALEGLAINERIFYYFHHLFGGISHDFRLPFMV